MVATDPHRYCENPESNGDSTQRGLAASLVECMGRESAMHVCQVNGWAGVLEILRNEAFVQTH